MGNDLRCEHCGLEMTAVVSHGLDQYGNPALRPILVAGDNGLFVAVQCPLHGETFHRVAVAIHKMYPSSTPQHDAQSTEVWRVPKMLETIL